MADYTQSNRPMAVTTPLGDDELLLESFTGTEAISELFSLNLELLAEAGTDVTFDSLIGEDSTIRIEQSDGGQRYFNGIIRRFERGLQLRASTSNRTFIRYRAQLVPKVWLLTLQANCRIFQQQTVPDILKQVLDGYDVSYQIQGTYYTREYCVQYRESDFAFISRLMEEEGIYYYFTFTQDGHQMVISDAPQTHPDVPGPNPITFDQMEGGERPSGRIYGWDKVQQLQTGKVTLWDYNFQLPGKNLEASQPTLDSIQAGSVTHTLKLDANEDLEVYDYPGGYARWFDGVDPGGSDQSDELNNVFDVNSPLATVRIQQRTVDSLMVEGLSSCTNLVAGHQFNLSGNNDADGTYVLTRVKHEANMGGSYQLGSAPRLLYKNEFSCIPSAMPYRPARVTSRARIEGPQAAIVVGPQDQEIFTDKYGRVKVQFYWDREGESNQDSSCWLRVASPWAGQQWGMIHIPRVGQEVLVQFLEGDPDRPIILGSIYNPNTMPPFTLPDDTPKSGIVSRSTAQGDDTMFNSLYFDDTKGQELVSLHAEKDLQCVVENDDSLQVGFDKKDKGDQTIQIYNNQTISIGAGEDEADEGNRSTTVYKDDSLVVSTGNRSATIQKGDDSLEVSEGSRTATIEKDDSLVVSTGNRSVTVKQGDDSVEVSEGSRTTTIQKDDKLTISSGNLTISVDSGKVSVTAMQQIELTVGPSSIKISDESIELSSGDNSVAIGPAGVTIKGAMLTFESQAMATLKGAMVQVSGSGAVQIEGGAVMIN